MKILQIHKYFSPQKGGGSVTAFFQTKKLLEKKGNQVIIFSMQDDDNIESIYDKYFIKHFDINKANNFFQKISWGFKSIFNFEAQRKLENLIKKEKPEVAHIHNIYHYLTPSIFHTLKKHKIPMVFKLSDYKAICPNYKLFNKGKICEKCQGEKYYNCFLESCLKNSRSVSFVAMVEAYLHRFLKSYSKIDLFLAPSEFMKKKCVDFEIPANKIKILRNVIDVKDFSLDDKSYTEENYILCYGRISEEKGIEDLILAVRVLKEGKKLGENKLKIVGKGPLENYLKKRVKELNLEKEIIFEGFKSGLELKKIIKKAKLIVLPSVWYDNSPLVISEAQLLKKPVVISDKGGSKEMIINKKTGLVFKGGDVDDLVDKLREVLNMSLSERRRMGELGRKNIIEINNEEKYYEKLIGFYKKLISENNNLK